MAVQPTRRRFSADEYERMAEAGGVPETWLVDLKQETVTVYRDPSPSGYRTIRVLRRGERVSLAAFPEHDLAVDEILG